MTPEALNTRSATRNNVASRLTDGGYQARMRGPWLFMRLRARVLVLSFSAVGAIPRTSRSGEACQGRLRLRGDEVAGEFAELKIEWTERCPKALGSLIKTAEIQFHHEVTNQYLWSQF